MNSKQRRKQNRRFRYPVSLVGDPRISDMLEWCHRRYGDDGYLFSWHSHITFKFPTVERATEFKITWA